MSIFQGAKRLTADAVDVTVAQSGAFNIGIGGHIVTEAGTYTNLTGNNVWVNNGNTANGLYGMLYYVGSTVTNAAFNEADQTPSSLFTEARGFHRIAEYSEIPGVFTTNLMTLVNTDRATAQYNAINVMTSNGTSDQVYFLPTGEVGQSLVISNVHGVSPEKIVAQTGEKIENLLLDNSDSSDDTRLVLDKTSNYNLTFTYTGATYGWVIRQ